MEALSSGIPHITRSHLPLHVVPRCYGKPSSCRQIGGFQPTRPSACAITKKRFSMNAPIFHVGEPPVCTFLPHIDKDRDLGTSFAKSRLCRTPTRLPCALSEEDHQARLDNSACSELQPDSYVSEIAPFYSGPHGSKLSEKSSQLKSTLSFQGRYEKEILHKQMLSRLKAVEGEGAHKNHLVRKISDPDNEPLRLAGSFDTPGISLAEEDEKLLLDLREGPLRGTSKQKGEHTHNQRKKEMRSMLHNCLPPILERRGFQFSRTIFSKQENCQRAARLHVTVSYKMNYVLERAAYCLDVVGKSDINMLDQNERVDSQSKSDYLRKTKVFAGSMKCRTSTRETTSAKMGTMARERIEQIGLGRCIPHSGTFWRARVLDLNCHFYAGSRSTLRASSRVPMPAQNGAGRRLWSRAHSGGETAGNLFKDLLTIIGLVVFVVSGTYLFAIGQEYLKSEIWFKKNPFESVTRSHSAKETYPKPPNLNQTKILEITDESFYNTIQKRPTFVFFYSDWCPYCQKLDPTWVELGNILSSKGYDVQLARMDAEIHPIAAQNFKVVKYPTLIFFKGGIAVENYLGPRTINSFMKFIDENLHKKF